jgi:hypothetical protein
LNSRGGTSSSPSPRQSAAMGWFDGGVVLFGGLVDDAGVVTDSWIWNGQSWAEVDDGGTGWVATLEFPVIVSTGSELVLVGRGSSAMQTGVWNGHGWTLKTASGPIPRRWRFAMAAYRGTVVMFGGVAVSDASADESLGDTWTWDGGTTWAELLDGGSGEPLARDYAGAASFGGDAGPGLLLFGGEGIPPDAGPLQDGWTWNGSEWKRARAGDAGIPSGRVLPAMATAPGNTVLLFGGLDEMGLLNDTWTYSAAVGWRRISPAPPVSPSPRRAAGIAGRP